MGINNLTKVQRFIAETVSTEEEAIEIVESLAKINWHIVYSDPRLETKAMKRHLREQRRLKITDDRQQELFEMTYEEYLETPEWKAKIKAVMYRAKFRCELCSATKNFNVHHKTYDRVKREPLSDLILLCKSCHSKHHDKLPDLPAELKHMRRS